MSRSLNGLVTRECAPPRSLSERRELAIARGQACKAVFTRVTNQITRLLHEEHALNTYAAEGFRGRGIDRVKQVRGFGHREGFVRLRRGLLQSVWCPSHSVRPRARFLHVDLVIPGA